MLDEATRNNLRQTACNLITELTHAQPPIESHELLCDLLSLDVIGLIEASHPWLQETQTSIDPTLRTLANLLYRADTEEIQMIVKEAIWETIYVSYRHRLPSQACQITQIQFIDYTRPEIVAWLYQFKNSSLAAIHFISASPVTDELTLEKWQIFFSCLAALDFSDAHLKYDVPGGFTPKQWNHFIRSAKNSGLRISVSGDHLKHEQISEAQTINRESNYQDVIAPAKNKQIRLEEIYIIHQNKLPASLIAISHDQFCAFDCFTMLAWLYRFKIMGCTSVTIRFILSTYKLPAMGENPNFSSCASPNPADWAIFWLCLSMIDLPSVDLSNNKLWSSYTKYTEYNLKEPGDPQYIEPAYVEPAYVKWSDQSQKVFWSGVYFTHLYFLNLSGNSMYKLPPEDLWTFWRGVRFSHLVSIDLSSNKLNRFNQEQADVFMDGLKDSRLLAINLDNNNIDPQDVEELQAGLGKNISKKIMTTPLATSDYTFKEVCKHVLWKHPDTAHPNQNNKNLQTWICSRLNDSEKIAYQVDEKQKRLWRVFSLK